MPSTGLKLRNNIIVTCVCAGACWGINVQWGEVPVLEETAEQRTFSQSVDVFVIYSHSVFTYQAVHEPFRMTQPQDTIPYYYIVELHCVVLYKKSCYHSNGILYLLQFNFDE